MIENQKKIIVPTTKEIILPTKDLVIPTKVAIFDALDTTVMIYKPDEVLRTKEEKLIYDLENPGKYTPEGVALLDSHIKALGMEDLATSVRLSLTAKGKTEKQQFYILSDVLATEYCKSIGDTDEQLRLDVCKKIYHLVDPALFPKVLDYTSREYGIDVNMILLTQANPIMKQVYEQLVGPYGVSVMVAPDKSLNNLYKNDAELYKIISEILRTTTENMGLLDDAEKNITAAKTAGLVTEQYTGEDLTAPAKEMIDKLFCQSQETPLP